MLELDHVLVAVSELERARADVAERYGLTAVGGGRHAGWGTANAIVPLGDTYLELVAVVDADEASESTFGRWVAGAAPGRPFAWAVRTDDLDAVARRLGLEVTSGSRPTPAGEQLRWRVAGFEAAAADASLPFFLEWEKGSPYPGLQAPPASPLATPGRSPVEQRTTIARVLLRGDADRLAAWLGERTLPIAVEPGDPGVAGVVLAGASGEIVLG